MKRDHQKHLNFKFRQATAEINGHRAALKAAREAGNIDAAIGAAFMLGMVSQWRGDLPALVRSEAGKRTGAKNGATNRAAVKAQKAKAVAHVQQYLDTAEDPKLSAAYAFAARKTGVKSRTVQRYWLARNAKPNQVASLRELFLRTFPAAQSGDR